jgi:hypothetical protein
LDQDGFIMRNGQLVLAASFAGPTGQEQFSADKRYGRNRQRQEGGSGMMSGTQYLQGDPRSARKKFRFTT